MTQTKNGGSWQSFMSLHLKLLDIDHPLTLEESKLTQIEAHSLIYLSFLQRVKRYFPLFQNVILYFCPFKRDTTIIISFSLYRCKNLLRYYWSLSINMVNFLQFWNLRDALLNACFSQTVLAFKFVINNSWKRLKVPVDKT